MQSLEDGDEQVLLEDDSLELEELLDDEESLELEELLESDESSEPELPLLACAMLTVVKAGAA